MLVSVGENEWNHTILTLEVLVKAYWESRLVNHVLARSTDLPNVLVSVFIPGAADLIHIKSVDHSIRSECLEIRAASGSSGSS